MITAACRSRQATTQALSVSALALLMIAALAVVALFLPLNLAEAAAFAATVVGLAAVSVWSVKRALRPLETIERLMAQVITTDGESRDLPTVAFPSPVAEGWNRLTVLAGKWATWSELRRATLETAGGGGNATHDLIDALCEGVAATDVAGRIVQANPAFAAMCGATDHRALVDCDCATALRAPAEPLAQLAAAAHRKLAFEFALDSPSGPRTLRVVRTPRYGPQGELLGHAWLVRDVSQQRLADAMRDQFLTTATHELRTPLANISAYAETLATLDELDTDAQQQFYNVIQSEAVRLSQLVDDLLDVSRMQAGALAFVRREVDLERLVEEVAAKVEGTMQSRAIEFCREFPPKYPKLAADKGKLAAALVNLLGNAAKYTPDGGRVTFRVDVAAQRVEFSVADTGIGIAPDELSRVFDRFFRSDDERVRQIPGSGLGLALSQEVARLHGGDLSVDSELNVGSIFRLHIPLHATE